MTEHLSDGKFARKDVAGTAEVASPSGGRFKKGTPKPANSGRKKGTPNRVTREVKEWLAMMVNTQGVQEGVEAKIERGDTVAFFRALDHVLGKPVEKQDVNVSGNLTIRWAGE